MYENAVFTLLLNSARHRPDSRYHAWHDRTLGSHIRERNRCVARGFRFISISLHGGVAAPRYSAVMVDPRLFTHTALPIQQQDFPLLTADELTRLLTEQAHSGFGPVMIAATGSLADPRFAVVFEPQNPIAVTRLRLRSGSEDDRGSVQGMNAWARNNGLILRWAASYGSVGDEAFAGIWVSNTQRSAWNADGVFETLAEFDERTAVQLSGWARPAFVTANANDLYFSMYVENEIGPWVSRQAMSRAEYRAELRLRASQDYLPTCVQAAGSGNSTRFSAIFVKRLEPVPNQFNAAGPVASAGIDDVIFEAMRYSPVWNASLAIVRNKQLVYARGYSWGEPDWPLVQPTTRFRIASVSKLMGALGIYQLIDSGLLTLDTPVQEKLELRTPAGHGPRDERFSKITVRHLLENTSGLRSGLLWQDIRIRDAFRSAKQSQSWTLPVTPGMTDAYIAARFLLPDEHPGQVMRYNNCAYYLLGRVLAKVRGRATGFEALREFLFEPLDMVRSRPSPSRLSTMPSDEARYRAHDLKLGQSIIDESRPLIPDHYGTLNIAKTDTAGGFSMAATDLGRIIALLLSDADQPGLSRATIDQMMNNAESFQATWTGAAKGGLRAGHGWDRAERRSGGHYYAQKGGSLATSGNVLQIDGEWGFSMCWGGRASASAFYPDFPAVMDIAKRTTWTRDLFPDFGISPVP